MPDTMTLGMTIQVDAAQAKAVMDSLGVSTDQLAAKVSAGGGRMTEGFAQPREAARLLSEDLGLRLPRAITSSIARMQEFQAIASSVFALGAGVFAIEAAVRFAKSLKEVVDQAGGVVEAERQMTAAVKENEQAIVNYAATSHEAALQVIKEINAQLTAQEAAAEAHRQMMEAQVAHAGSLMILWQKAFGSQKEQIDLDKIAADMRAKLNAIISALGVNEVKWHKEAAAEELKALAIAEKHEQLLIRVAQAGFKGQQQITEAINKHAEAQIKDFFAAEELRKANLRAFPAELLDGWRQVPELLEPAVTWTERFTEALNIQSAATTEAAKSAVAANVVALGQHILGRRNMAIIEAVVETAKGFGALGHYDFWGAAQHFTSAAVWGSIAGEGGGKYGPGGAGIFGGGGRGGGGGGGSVAATRNAPAAPALTTVNPQAAPMKVEFHIHGDVIAEETIVKLARRLTKGVAQGNIHLLASTSIGPAQSLT